MAVVWLTPGPAVSWSDYRELVRVLGWRDGEPFHPSESELSETAYVAPGGTRVALYHSRFGGTGRIAAYGEHAELVADAIARRIPTSERTVAAAFHRFDVVNTAVCATSDGAWWIQSRLQTVAFQRSGGALEVGARDVWSPVAIAAGERAVYLTSCDDPRASRLARIDRETRELRWLCELDRPGQLCVLGDVAYVAVADGLVAVDRAGAIERRPLGVPAPWLLAGTRDRLYWVDATRKSLFEYRDGRARVIASGKYFQALDVDDDRIYLLDGDTRVVALEGERTREIEIDPWAGNGRAGLVRVGPVLVTLREWDESYQTRVRREYIPIGYPRLAEAPADLVEEARDDEHAREVLVDWLADRGIRASPHVLERVLGTFDAGDDDWRGSADTLPGPLAVPLASHDRETGYFASGRNLTIFTADELV